MPQTDVILKDICSIYKILHFNKYEKKYLNSLKAYTKDTWEKYKNDDEMIAIKEKIKNDLFKYQNGRCAYCGEVLVSSTKTKASCDREHIAPKSSKKKHNNGHPEFIFEPLNLALSCIECNRFLKNDFDTIIKGEKKSIYKYCSFNIVHPYFDSYNDFFRFYTLDEKQVLIQKKNGLSKTDDLKASNTLDKFDLKSPIRAKYRVENIVRIKDKDNPNEKLIQSAVYHKKKVKVFPKVCS